MEDMLVHFDSNSNQWLTHEPCTSGVVQMQSVRSIVPGGLPMHFVVQDYGSGGPRLVKWPEEQTHGLHFEYPTPIVEPLILSGGPSSGITIMWG